MNDKEYTELYKKGVSEPQPVLKPKEMDVKMINRYVHIEGKEYIVRQEGTWQITDAWPHNVYCSVCHAKFAQAHWEVWKDGSLPRNYCPNCGADMREKQ